MRLSHSHQCCEWQPRHRNRHGARCRRSATWRSLSSHSSRPRFQLDLSVLSFLPPNAAPSSLPYSQRISAALCSAASGQMKRNAGQQQQPLLSQQRKQQQPRPWGIDPRPLLQRLSMVACAARCLLTRRKRSLLWAEKRAAQTRRMKARRPRGQGRWRVKEGDTWKGKQACRQVGRQVGGQVGRQVWRQAGRGRGTGDSWQVAKAW